MLCFAGWKYDSIYMQTQKCLIFPNEIAFYMCGLAGLSLIIFVLHHRALLKSDDQLMLEQNSPGDNYVVARMLSGLK